jgi:hypothetical protein
MDGGIIQAVKMNYRKQLLRYVLLLMQEKSGRIEEVAFRGRGRTMEGLLYFYLYFNRKQYYM